MMMKKVRKVASCALAAAMALTMVLPTTIVSFADTVKLTDISKHWAKEYIEKAVEKGFVNGYLDGTFKPDNPITRAEFIKMLNSVLGNTGTSSDSFSDVSSEDWYQAEVSKAISAAYVSGYEDGKFMPENKITRQEAAVMLSRVLPVYGTGKTLKVFADESTVADWAYPAVERVYGKGYLGAYNDGDLHPLDNLTRGQAAKILVDVANTEKIVTANQTIVKAGVTVTNTIFSNQFSVGSDVKDGNAVISNCVVLGSLNIKGGGTTDYVTILNSRLASCTVKKDDSAVKVVAKGESTIKRMLVSEIATIEEADLANNTFGAGIEEIEVLRAADLTLYGTYPEINVTGEKVDLTLKTGSITQLNIGEEASKTTITASSGTTITTATVNAGTDFVGTGTIKKMYVNSNDVTYEKDPESVEVGSGVKDPTKGGDSDDPIQDFGLVISPANGTTNVSVGTDITLSFDSAITHRDGERITSSEIEDLISVRKSSTTGTPISFSATINSARTKITITPDYNLSQDTRYYIVIPASKLKNAEGYVNESITSYFNVGASNQSVTTTFSPAKSETGVSPTVNPTITFNESVLRYSGSSVTSAYIMSDAITLRKTNSSGAAVPFTASINSSATKITIIPDAALAENTTYYLAVNASKLKNHNGVTIPAESVTWTVGSASLSNLQVLPGDKYISVSADAKTSGTMYSIAVLKSSGSTTPTAAQVMAGKNSSGRTAEASASVNVTSGNHYSQELSNLSTATAYNVYTVLEDRSGTLYTVFSNSVTTESKLLQGLTVKPVYSDNSKGSNVLSGFKPENSSYTVSVPGDTTKVLVTPDTGAFAGTVTVNGYDSDTPVTLSGTTTTVTVEVKEASKTSKKYTISVVKEPEISTISVDGSLITSRINGKVIDYSSGPNQTKYTIKITTTDTRGSYEIYTAAGEKITNTITTGGSVQLSPSGESQFKIQVYSADKASTTTYTLKLNQG